MYIRDDLHRQIEFTILPLGDVSTCFKVRKKLIGETTVGGRLALGNTVDSIFIIIMFKKKSRTSILYDNIIVHR